MLIADQTMFWPALDGNIQVGSYVYIYCMSLYRIQLLLNLAIQALKF